MMREQLAAGLAQPAIVVDLTLDQVSGAEQAVAPRESPLLAAFRRFPERDPVAANRNGCARRRTGVRPAVRLELEDARNVPARHVSQAGATADRADVVARRTGRPTPR